jgi:hypothetical protein
MPYQETSKEKEKREAYMKANKERGIRAEKQRDYEMFGTTEQNIPQVNPMGDVVAPAAKGMKKGGVAKTVTKEMEYDYKTGKKSFAGTIAQRDRHAEKEGKRVAKDLAYDKSKGMKKGGSVSSASKRADGIAQKGKTKGRYL